MINKFLISGFEFFRLRVLFNRISGVLTLSSGNKQKKLIEYLTVSGKVRCDCEYRLYERFLSGGLLRYSEK